MNSFSSDSVSDVSGQHFHVSGEVSSRDGGLSREDRIGLMDQVSRDKGDSSTPDRVLDNIEQAQKGGSTLRSLRSGLKKLGKGTALMTGWAAFGLATALSYMGAAVGFYPMGILGYIIGELIDKEIAERALKANPPEEGTPERKEYDKFGGGIRVFDKDSRLTKTFTARRWFGKAEELRRKKHQARGFSAGALLFAPVSVPLAALGAWLLKLSGEKVSVPEKVHGVVFPDLKLFRAGKHSQFAALEKYEAMMGTDTPSELQAIIRQVGEVHFETQADRDRIAERRTKGAAKLVNPDYDPKTDEKYLYDPLLLPHDPRYYRVRGEKSGLKASNMKKRDNLQGAHDTPEDQRSDTDRQLLEANSKLLAVITTRDETAYLALAEKLVKPQYDPQEDTQDPFHWGDTRDPRWDKAAYLLQQEEDEEEYRQWELMYDA